jgi:aspartate carbamoyltransferase catalytic subunit
MTQKGRVEKSDSEQTSAVRALAPPRSQSLLSVTDLNLEDIGELLALATVLETEDPLVRANRLAKRRVALLFYESSTRTRTSFELAAKSLGADTALISSQSSSIEKGESLRDTGITLKALGAECIILRHLSSGAPYVLAQATGMPVLNAGDGMHEHPSQALLDLRTILHATARGQRTIDPQLLEGITVSITGDILHSRVARSNALLLPRLGARVILCGPPALLPDVAADLGPGITIERDFDRALEASQIVMMLRIQKERLAGMQIDLEQYVDRYQLDEKRLCARAPQAFVMHPGPMIRGLEITSEVADGARSVIPEQVRHGVAVRMALVHRALEPCAASDTIASKLAAAHSAAPSVAAAPIAKKALPKTRRSPSKSSVMPVDKRGKS